MSKYKASTLPATVNCSRQNVIQLKRDAMPFCGTRCLFAERLNMNNLCFPSYFIHAYDKRQ